MVDGWTDVLARQGVIYTLYNVKQNGNGEGGEVMAIIPLCDCLNRYDWTLSANSYPRRCERLWISFFVYHDNHFSSQMLGDEAHNKIRFDGELDF